MNAIAFILYRYLLLSWINKKKSRNGSAISILIPVFGVAIGVFAFTVVISVMAGFVENIKRTMLQLEPHIVLTLTSEGTDSTEHFPKIKEFQNKHPEILAISPFQNADVILQARDKGVIASLQGVDSLSINKLGSIEKFFNQGTHLSDLNDYQASHSIQNSTLFPTIILGVDLMNQLNLHIGEVVTLVSPIPDEGPGGLSPTQLPVVITGYLNSGHFSFDKKIVLSSIKTANLFLQRQTNSIQGYNLTLKDPMQAEHIAQQLNLYFAQLQRSNHERKLVQQAIPWTTNNQSLLKALTLEHYGMVFVLIMIILVGCFSITISLLLSIRRKSKEMAILRSLGLKQADLSQLYLFHGLIIGGVGVIIGLVFGFTSLYYIHHYHIPFITSSYSSEPLPVLINLNDMIFVAVGSIILSILAAIWPAYEVKNLNVVEILSIRN